MAFVLIYEAASVSWGVQGQCHDCAVSATVRYVSLVLAGWWSVRSRAPCAFFTSRGLLQIHDHIAYNILIA